MDFDVIVIGSGFGGAITGCRLAEAGYRVLILERGRRWDKDSYPRKPGDMWVWDHAHPEREHGWLDLRLFPHMAVAAGAGVGGGSLIYANVSCEAPAKIFENGWPKEITYQELQPYYRQVASFMNVQQVPDNQWTRRMKLMQEAAGKAGFADRFTKLELAVSFDPEWTYEQDDPFNPAKSKKFLNAQGVEQGTCVHLGNCDFGCDVYAKNTLDRNYIPWAEKHGAQVRELHLVTNLEPVTGGYRVSYDRIDGGKRVAGSQTARLVIVAAGSMGSTELLLRAKEVTGSLPGISPFLGRNWSSNGDFLTPAFYDREIDPSWGPTIATAINFLDGSQNGQTFWVEDGGIPNLLGGILARAEASGVRAKLLIDTFGHLLRQAEPFRNVMPWFAQGVDAANGVLSLKRSLLTGELALHLDWDIAKSRQAIDTIVAMHERLSRATGGNAVVPPTWSLLHDLITPHPLGGCNMGNTAADGVVDHKGEVFGYRNLYVADGAIIPEALGVNPSRTIGALAERIAKIIREEGR
ncbi:MAG TPA: GMC family oxidoreductase [Bryobacteraceae bacterium]|jgi:cholesterol oxidase|nr:GMC family oxidoreductase [Bryobacteraceae bacterium]